MKYTKFTLENFKGISKPVVIDIGGKLKEPLCLVGNNESGKTTILKGIELIGKLCKGHVLKSGEAANYRPKVGIDFTGKIELGVGISFDTLDIKRNFQLQSIDIDEPDIREQSERHNSLVNQFLNSIRDNTNNIFIKFVYEYEASHMASSFINVNENIGDDEAAYLLKLIGKNLPEIIYLDDFCFDVPDIIRFSKNNDEEDSSGILNSRQNKEWQNIFQDILKGATDKNNKRKKVKVEPPQATSVVDPFSFFNSLVTFWLRDHKDDQDAVEQRLLGMSGFINEVITKDWEDISGLKSSFDRFAINRKDSSDGNFDDYSLKVYQGNNSFALSERSKGCRWFFCFKILTQIRVHRDNSDVVFLLDEPASNLHIHPQEKILANLKKLAKTKQVIYSTHAPHLIDADNLSNCIIVDNKKVREIDDAKIEVSRFDDASKRGKQLQPLAPIAERAIIRAVNPDGRQWSSKIWDIVSKINTATSLAEKSAILSELFKQ